MKLTATACALTTAFGMTAIPPAYHYAAGHLTPRMASNDTIPDAIMVFTGDSERVVEGYDLYLTDFPGKLMISGREYPADAQTPVIKALADQADQNRVFIDPLATSTIENAQNGAKWAIENNVKSILLITSDYHMERSYFELRRLLPDRVQIFEKPIPGIASKKMVDSETNRLLCRMYETFLDGSFCYQTRRVAQDFGLIMP